MLPDPIIFDKAIQSWSAVDLPRLQKQLDESGLEFQNYQKDSLVARKQLAKETKSFRKLAQDEQAVHINQLLKSYQREIDSLAKKNKNVDNAFFQVYRAIAEAPDPKALLESSQEAVSSMPELQTAREQNRALEERLVGYADYEQLKQRISQLEQAAAENSQAQVQAKEDEWKALLEEKEENWGRREADLKKQVEDVKVREEMMRLKLEHRNKAMDGEDQDSTPSNSLEVHLLSRDVESSKLRVMELEKRNEQLRREVSQAKSGAQDNMLISELSAKVSTLEGENAVLVARLEHERQNADKVQGELRQLKEAHVKETIRVNGEIENLKAYQSKTQDYDAVKKELEILRQIELGEEEGSESPEGVDSAIVQRNKRLNNEVIEYRAKNDELNKQLSALEIQLKTTAQQLDESRQVCAKLENDLESVETSAVNNEKWESMSMISSVAGGASTLNGRVSPAASIAGATDTRSIIGNSGADSGILPIITQQRDRFRRKNKELEEETKKQFSKILDMKREIRTLKSDNSDLYEKIRFMEYHQTPAKGSNATDDVESRYRESYESKLHPIERFRQMESDRINSRMSPFERVFVQVTKLILSTKTTRLLFVGYCVGLHFLVLLLTVFLINNTTTSTVTDHSILTGSTGGIAKGIDDVSAVAGVGE